MIITTSIITNYLQTKKQQKQTKLLFITITLSVRIFLNY